MGETMSQNRQGHILGHVKDLGGDYADPNTRGYMTRAEMLFHADACDYVGLLCLHGAKSGGESRVASSVTVYNRILERRPDLAKVLCEDFYRSHTGEVNPGEKPYFTQPIFSFIDGYFSATGAGAAIDKAQKLPGVPPLHAGAAGGGRALSDDGRTNARSTSASSPATSSSSTISSRCTPGANTRTGRKRRASAICCGCGCPIPTAARSRRTSAKAVPAAACTSRASSSSRRSTSAWRRSLQLSAISSVILRRERRRLAGCTASSVMPTLESSASVADARDTRMARTAG